MSRKLKTLIKNLEKISSVENDDIYVFACVNMNNRIYQFNITCCSLVFDHNIGKTYCIINLE